MKHERIRLLFAVALSVGLLSGAFAYEKVPAEIVRALGTTRGKAISTGLVFIDGKYLKPPYRVTRAGNQIQINGRPVTGPLVSWEKFLDTQPPSNVKVTEVEESADAEPASKSAPEKDGVDPAAPKDGGNAPPPADDAAVRPSVRIVGTRYAADDLDDFNPNRKNDSPDKMKLTDIPPDSEDDKARQKRAEEEKKAEAEESKDDGDRDDEEKEESNDGEKDGDGEKAAESSSEGEDGVDPASPEGEAAAAKAKAKAEAEKKARPVERRTRKVVTLEGKFDLNFRAQKMLQPIDKYRKSLESALRRGGYLFVGTNPARKYLVGRTSEAVAAGELLKKLPELMRDAKDSESFCDDVRSAGLFSYVNLQISRDLYRNKTDYYALIQRRRSLADENKLNRMMNSHGR